MNYRHIYHAGNFADVVKHLVLVLVLQHLKLKASPVRVIDTHAGIGLYDLSSEEAQKTGEWRSGIGRVLDAEIPQEVLALIKPYLDIVADDLGADGQPLRYPGSPLIARRLMRADDVLVANEAHPDDAKLLNAQFAKDKQTKVLSRDGWQVLKSVLPPKERRGVVLIDPPFEAAGEFQRLLDGLRDGARRFATGTFLLWYPIKEVRDIERFHHDAAALGLPKLMAVDVFVRSVRTSVDLAGSGLLILNPPYTLVKTLDVVLPFFVDCLGQGPGANYRISMLTSEQGAPLRQG